MTKGMKTSEFYLAVAGLCVGACMAFNNVDAGAIGAVLSPVMVYIGGRSYAKKGE